jgi:hypothetical protein
VNNKINQTFQYFDTMLQILQYVHYLNEPLLPMPGVGAIAVKANIAATSLMTNAQFAAIHVGVARYIHHNTVRQWNCGLFAGSTKYEKRAHDYLHTKDSKTIIEIREELNKMESAPDRDNSNYKANYTADGNSSSSADHTDLQSTVSGMSMQASANYTQTGNATPEQTAKALKVACEICISNTMRTIAGTSHDAARCKQVQNILDNPAQSIRDGFTKDLNSLGLPPAKILLELGRALGPMKPPDHNKKSPGNDRSRSRRNSRDQGDSENNSRNSSRANSRASSQDRDDRNRGNSRNKRDRSNSRNRDSRNDRQADRRDDRRGDRRNDRYDGRTDSRDRTRDNTGRNAASANSAAMSSAAQSASQLAFIQSPEFINAMQAGIDQCINGGNQK